MSEESENQTPKEPLSDFIHLRVHTAYSLLEGALKLGTLMKLCERYRMPAVGMTDTNNMFGAFDMSHECEDHGIQPLIGCQTAVDMGLEDKRFSSAKDQTCPDSVVLLVQNQAGYDNMLKLSRKAYMETEPPAKPNVPFSYLKEHSDGLICLTGGCSGPVGRLLLDGKTEKAEEALKMLKSAFGNRLYIELQRHGLAEEKQIEETLIDWAYKHDIPLVATNEAFFADREMYEAHDALICIAEKTYIDVNERRRLTPEHYFKSPEEMKELFSDLPEAIQNTVVIAKRCGFMVTKKPPALPRYPDCGDKTEAEVLQERARAGLEKRLQVHVFKDTMSDEEKEALRQKYVQRLEYELGVIIQMDFPGYFLIVSDFIQWSKAHGIPVGPGRGSGAGSVVAWSLTITDLDPLRFNLLFERFLNPERVNMPDFDVDFCQDRRGETIEYVRHKYGLDQVAQIITFGKLQAKAVIRDVGRVLQMNYGAVDRLSKMVPNVIGITLKEAFEQEPEFNKLRASDPQIDRLLDIAVKLEGLFRNASTHAAGVVVGQTALDKIVPIYRDPSSDMPVTQYNMKYVESTGLVKFDFLGLKTLTVIAEAVKMVRRRSIDLNISEIPLDDKETYELLHRAETDGVFQLESGGMRKVLRDLQPDTLEDVIAIVSLYRPGPMDSIPTYISRKHGREKPDYMHPMLEDILKETYGIMIYQEQVMQIAQKMAGYSLGGADLLRRAMGKKKPEEMAKQKVIFIEGAVKNGVDKSKAEDIFSRMEKFASYGFNKSHAAAYALIAYQTAYLKAHYPVEFMAATMTYDKQNTDKLSQFKRELMRLGIPLLPPHINHAFVQFSVEDGSVRYALSAVKGVGEAAMESVVAEREKNGKFKSISDFIRRLDTRQVNRKCMESLVKAGAFDGLEKNRALLHANLDLLMQHAAAAGDERRSSQINLFGGTEQSSEIKLAPVKEWPLVEKLKMEAEAIGFYLSAHPLDSYAKSLERLHIMTYADVVRTVAMGGDCRGKIAAIVSGVREKISQKGTKYAFISASDSTGSFELSVFSETYSANKETLKSNKPLILTISAEREEGADAPRMIIQRAEALEDVISKMAGGMMISFSEESCIEEIRSILSKASPGRSHVRLSLQIEKWEVDILLEKTYTFTADLWQEMRSLPGVSEVKEI